MARYPASDIPVVFCRREDGGIVADVVPAADVEAYARAKMEGFDDLDPEDRAEFWEDPFPGANRKLRR